MAVNSQANDAMIRRLEKELEERNAFAQGLIASVQDAERDLNDTEKAQLTEVRTRMGVIKEQIEELSETARIASDIAQRAKQVDLAITTARRSGESGPVEYRSAGHWMVDLISAASGSRDARERLELFERAAAHQKTGDNLGIVPDPIVGDVINFIDAARPIVSFVGPRDMPSATWHRPKVTQSTAVAVQGTAGGAGDEKTELTSQKMTITRLTGNAVTYGGYVNVSRQNIDFSSPSALDAVINDLAAQYAIETEAAIAAELATTGTTAVGYGTTPTNDLVAAAVWEAAANVYAAVKGQGRLLLAVAPDTLGIFGPLFAPVNPQNAQSAGFTAGQFAQGVMGSISGVPVAMSAGLASGEAFMFSTAAIEAYEQRVGALQAIEPSVLGTQVAYAGYFTPLTIEDGGIVPLTATAP
jgi:HK97 family phage major capsid protein